MVHGLGEKAAADVVVVGAGPSGASTAYHLASLGVDVLLLDKAAFPRDKVCGDGLTPAAVHELLLMGVDTTGWIRNRGLTVIGGGHTVRMDWPDQKSLPGYGMARSRMDLDHALVERAVRSGARLHEGVSVTAALQDASGRVVGVRARTGKGKDQVETEVRANLVVDAGGVSARLSTSLGIEKDPDKPMGVAARTYFHSPRGDEEWMESHLELWAGEPGASDLLPGYGWIFPLGDGLVNVGLGSVSSNARATALPYKQVFADWTSHLPQEWGFTPANQVGPLRSAALPMSFNRKPHYTNGLLLVGDAGGMVSPFNGEGIAPGMKAGRLAAGAIAQALGRSTRVGVDRALSAYPEFMREEYGGYYTLGRVFVRLIENPKIMRMCATYGLPVPRLMTLVHKLLSDGYERKGGDLDDRLITTLSKVVPSA
ncbi:geranylgeranyl reductase family protein [Schaalia sp. 19OD2882]|uniref:geranylgeranyl reductase family protein n=1 Tax=Schaalia sp. 19OD2882 TaxID=2794089 RepID=UPI001C1E92B7|nr:geranylgeranyl reductase family protein [Schaalia sp. 19OD2882]QWW19875.1 geranylgeranyl reductase family protein [Schaalia sp. 19OD2882]